MHTVRVWVDESVEGEKDNVSQCSMIPSDAWDSPILLECLYRLTLSWW